MNWHLVTYADENFREKQQFLHRTHKEKFIHHPYNREWIVSTDFYKENQNILMIWEMLKDGLFLSLKK